MAGEYQMVRDGDIHFVPSDPRFQQVDLSSVEAKRILTILRGALKDGDIDRDAVCAAIEKTPELSSIASAVPQTREELYAFIQALVAVLVMFAGAGAAAINWRRNRLQKAQARENRRASAERARAAKALAAKEAKAKRRTKKTPGEPPEKPARKQWKAKRPGK
jgi:hypothetical protein